jgi:hypothetical protein
MKEKQNEQAEDMRDRVSGERLTTKDMAMGTAPARARDESPRERQATPQQREQSTPLFDSGEAEGFRSRWMNIQTEFVDEPRKSVEKADELVAATMKRLAEIFAGERESLERELGRRDDVSTEDLRIALQRYRSFFDRLLSV